MIFEAHITFPSSDAYYVKQKGDKWGWKYSQIDGDPVLGNNVYCYLSKHSDDYLELYNHMELFYLENCKSLHIIRKKIELIMYDWKSDRIEQWRQMGIT